MQDSFETWFWQKSHNAKNLKQNCEKEIRAALFLSKEYLSQKYPWECIVRLMFRWKLVKVWFFFDRIDIFLPQMRRKQRLRKRKFNERFSTVVVKKLLLRSLNIARKVRKLDSRKVFDIFWTDKSIKVNMSRDMTKPTKWLCAQWRLRSAWASAQSDQSLRCPHEESLGP